MRRVALDCSVTMAWCFEDQADSMSEKLLDGFGDSEAVVPAIWPLEVADVLVVAERHGRLSAADSTRFLEVLRRLPILVEDASLPRAAEAVLSTARQTGLSSYDAAYLELAMRAGVPLASRDRR